MINWSASLVQSPKRPDGKPGIFDHSKWGESVWCGDDVTTGSPGNDPEPWLKQLVFFAIIALAIIWFVSRYTNPPV